MEILESEGLERSVQRGPERLAQTIQAPKWAVYVICSVLGLFLSAAPFSGGPAPFGIALLSAIGCGGTGMFCLLGASVGYCLSFGMEAGAQMICGCLLVQITTYLLRNHWIHKLRVYPPTVSMLACGITRVSLYCLTGGISLLLMVRTGIHMAVCGISAYLFSDVINFDDPRTPTAEIRRCISTIFILSCFLLGISRFLIWYSVSVGRILAVWLLLILSSFGGPLYGAAAGTILGITMDIGIQANAVFTPMYSLSAMLAGLFSKHKKSAFLIAFILTYAAAAFCLSTREIRVASLIEMSCAAILFLLCPQKWIVTLGSFVQPQHTGNGEAALRKFTSGRIGSLSHAYRALYDVAVSASEAAENDCDLSKVFDRAAERVCTACSKQNRCWGTDAENTLNIMNDVSLKIKTKGILQKNDFPVFFQKQCDRIYQYTESVNGELRLRAYRLQMQQKVREEQAVLWDQYRDFSDILSSFSRSLSGVCGGDPPAEQRLVRYLRAVGIEANASVFRDGKGRLHAIIESRCLETLLQSSDYLDSLSAVLGVRLCMPENQNRADSVVLLEAEPFSASVGIAAIQKRGESVTGDRGTYFKTDQGELYVILSDGMGSGSAAAESSIGAIRILENFLRAGVAPSNAMKLLNAASLVKDCEHWGYATVDLMCIDLFTGDACFYKYGAAPSYVRSGGVIKKVRNTSFAAGLSYEAGKTPDVMRMRLKPGSIAVIASDGIVSDGKDLWLRKLLESSKETNMKKLAGDVVQTAIREYGRSDDMTALAIKLEVRA